jgi:type IV pilus assembly protein PilC
MPHEDGRMSAAAVAPAKPIGPAVAANLYRELSDLTGSGSTPAEAAAALREDAESPAVARLLAEVAQDLEREPSLARALERHSAALGPETVAFVAAAERQNALSEGLALLAGDCERRRELAARLPVSLLWPLFLLGFLALVTLLLMIFVIPAFKEVFSAFGADLPGPTLAVIAISDCVAAYWWLVVALVILLPLGLGLARRRQSPLATALDRAFLGLPGVKRLLVRLLVGRMVALLAGAAACRIPFAPAIAYLASTLNNGALRAMVAALGRDVEGGMPLAAAWRKHAELPRRVARIVEVGERSGRLAPALERAGWSHAAEAASAIAVFRQTLFVATYVLAGLMVALVVIAMYLPIFKMGSLI